MVIKKDIFTPVIEGDISSIESESEYSSGTIDSDDEYDSSSFSDSSEYSTNEMCSVSECNRKNFTYYLNKLDVLLEKNNKEELLSYLKEIVPFIDKSIFSKSDTINDLENTIFRFEFLIYIKETTKYIDILKKE